MRRLVSATCGRPPHRLAHRKSPIEAQTRSHRIRPRLPCGVLDGGHKHRNYILASLGPAAVCGFEPGCFAAPCPAPNLYVDPRRADSTGGGRKATLLTDPVRVLQTKPAILIFELDLARPSSSESFASAEVPTLSILLNAGISRVVWEITPETQTEAVFQVNFLSNAILSVRLLPLLRSSAERSGAKSYLCIVRYADSKVLVSCGCASSPSAPTQRS
ncbi:hypothetical protein DFH07DRAFT_518645 [Mycena maculata]|uniref:Uncharacterized protein n=1 Tax=Mycena maculata TaxID=230809 RepID=A0AAD7IZ46_9AGAR|nr:hypothetical protein DFH07DRAFT_518645 [Mycena maculata]